MDRVRAVRSLGGALIVVAAGAVAAAAFPVFAPFGTFPKAVYFTGTQVPREARTLGIADGASAGGAFETWESGIIMTALGDGSWACTATVYPGSSLEYYFEMRLPAYDFVPDSTTSYTTTEPGGARNQDSNRTRTVVIPDTAVDGYVLYNAYGDRSVWGAQGVSDTDLSLSNAYLSAWRGTDLLTPTQDADTSGTDGGATRLYNVTGAQSSLTAARLFWEHSHGGDGLVAAVEADSAFSALPNNYGYRILRAESSPAVAYASLAFTDVTPISGQSVWSDDDNDPWNVPTSFTDTSVSAVADSVFVYVIVYRNAYGMNEDSAGQFFPGGFAEIRWADLAITVDGQVDLLYGPWIGEDPDTDHANFRNLDLARLWATRDVAYFYFTFEVAADLDATPWGFYGLFIDTTGDASGATDFMTGAAEGKNARFSGNRRPEYAITIKNNGDPNTPPPVDEARLWRWNGAGWTDMGAIDGLAHAETAGRTFVEFATDAASIGDPARIWIEAFSTGNSYGDTIIDTVNRLFGEAGNDDWNAVDFSATQAASLALSTPFPPAVPPPMGVTTTVIDTAVFVAWVAPPINPALVDTVALYVDTDPGRVSTQDSRALTAALTAADATWETSGLVAGATYYVSAVAWGTAGDSAASAMGSFTAGTGSGQAVSTRTDSTGVTRVVVPAASFPSADTFFWIEILNFDEMYQLSFFDTGELAAWTKMMNATRAAFFDPTVTVFTTNEYSDTRSPVRHVIVRRPDGSVAPAGYFRGSVSFYIPYLTEAGGEILAGTPYREDRLIMRKLDEGKEVWIAPPGAESTAVEAANDRVMVVTSDFSIWTLLVAAGPITDFSQLVVYPNPFNAREYLAAGHPAPARITFAFIPTSTDVVEIFSVDGTRVRTLNRDDPREFEAGAGGLLAYWDAKNDYGRDVASGVYLFWIRGAGQTKVGKVAVIK